MSLLTEERGDDVYSSSLNGRWHMFQRARTRFRYNKCDNEHVQAVSLKIHTYSNSKHLVCYMHALSIYVSHSRILRIETQLAHAVIQ